MAWLGLAAVLGAIAICVHWATRRTDALGRVRPFPWFSIALLLVVACVALYPWFARRRLEGRLGAAATALIGVEADVHCQSFGDAFVDVGAEQGYVAFGPDGVPERETLLKRDQCGALADYVASDKRSPSRDEVVAVHVLTHEAIHMSGVTDEAETECLAVQRDAAMARALGAPDEPARALALSYWQTVYPRMSPEYRSEQCAPGGTMDARLPDAPWAFEG